MWQKNTGIRKMGKMAAGILLMSILLSAGRVGQVHAEEPRMFGLARTLMQTLNEVMTIAESEWATVTVDDLTVEGNMQVDLTACVSESMITGGKVRQNSTSAPLQQVEGLKVVSPATIGKDENTEKYYILPSGYQVVSGSGITLYREEKASGAAKQASYYSKGTENAEVTGWTAVEDTPYAYTAVTVGGNTTYGIGWDTKFIQIEDYQPSTKNARGQVLAGTTLENKHFTVIAKVGSKSYVLEPDDFSVEIVGAAGNPKQIPMENKDCTVQVRYLNNPTGAEAELTDKEVIKVTPLKLDHIDVTVSKNTKGNLYVGTVIEKKLLTVHAVWYNVLSGRSESSEVKDFTLKPDKIQVDGNNLIEVVYQDGQMKASKVVTIQGYGVKALKAKYTGEDVVVGQEFDESKLEVTLVYSDGKEEVVKAGYLLPGGKTVMMPGQNSFIISFTENGIPYTANFTVPGIAKAITEIKADYTGPDLIVGSMIDTSYVVVNAVYNDGSKVRVHDVLLSTNKVEKIGENVITVTYNGMSCSMVVNGTEKLPYYIMAMYKGEPVIAGNDINPNNIKVTAYYSDGTMEDVTDFTLSMKTLTGVGINTITVTYKKTTAQIYVTCTPRVATAIKAVYKGQDVEKGSSFSRDKVIVTATFNDGSSEQVTGFVLQDTTVKYIGENTYELSYGGLKASFKVIGIAKTITGKGTLDLDVSNDKYDDVQMTVKVEGQLVKENMALDVESYDHGDLKKIVRKTTKTGKYLGFDLEIEGYEFLDNQYMTIRITVPVGMDPTKVAVYYTPNKKTVMAQLGGGLISSNVYEFYAYREGTYVLLEAEKSMLKHADLRGEEVIKPFICVSGAEAVMVEGGKLNLSAMVLNGTPDISNEFKWYSDDRDVATISSAGVLTAWDDGYVEITVSTKDGKLSHSFEIEVMEPDDYEEY